MKFKKWCFGFFSCEKVSSTGHLSTPAPPAVRRNTLDTIEGNTLDTIERNMFDTIDKRSKKGTRTGGMTTHRQKHMENFVKMKKTFFFFFFLNLFEKGW